MAVVDYQVIRERWKLDMWMDYISKSDDIAEGLSHNLKVDDNIENVILKNCACAILSFKEMLVLLSQGYPDGALMLTRNVYEAAIITQFIYNNYLASPDLIERFFADQNVKAYKNRKELYEAIAEKSPDLDWPKKAIEMCQQSLSDLTEKYGKISGQYWWAQAIFPDSKRSVSFSQIDKAINGDKLLRSLYKRACIGIHISSASPYLLGRDNEEGNRLYTLATDKGFEAPLLLGMISFENIVDVLCHHWKLKKDDLFPNMETEYREYAQKVFR
jgi:hypothetical protein